MTRLLDVCFENIQENMESTEPLLSSQLVNTNYGRIKRGDHWKEY